MKSAIFDPKCTVSSKDNSKCSVASYVYVCPHYLPSLFAASSLVLVAKALLLVVGSVRIIKQQKTKDMFDLMPRREKGFLKTVQTEFYDNHAPND